MYSDGRYEELKSVAEDVSKNIITAMEKKKEKRCQKCSVKGPTVNQLKNTFEEFINNKSNDIINWLKKNQETPFPINNKEFKAKLEEILERNEFETSLPPKIDDSIYGLPKILVLGINPRLIDKNDIPAFLDHIPNYNEIKCKMLKKTIYTDYFSKIYELFPHDVIEKYVLIWQNIFLFNKYYAGKFNEFEDKLNKICNSCGDKENCEGSLVEKAKRFLGTRIKSVESISGYIVFSDFIFVKTQNAGPVKEILTDDIKKKIFELFKEQLRYYNPKVVLINSAPFSDVIEKLLPDDAIERSEDNISYKYRYYQDKSTHLILLSSVSGKASIGKNIMPIIEKKIGEKLRGYMGGK